MNTNDWFYGKPGSWPDGEAAQPAGELQPWIYKLLLRISADCAQTALEDPIKYSDGWVLHSQAVLQDIAEAARMARAALQREGK